MKTKTKVLLGLAGGAFLWGLGKGMIVGRKGAPKPSGGMGELAHLCVLGPLNEESTFRQGLNHYVGPLAGSAIFGLAHLPESDDKSYVALRVADAALGGMAYSVAYGTAGIVGSTVVHGLHNLGTSVGRSLTGAPSTRELNVGGFKVTAEIATDAKACKKGLSSRSSLADDRGMIFVFPFGSAFWMRKTTIPLSIAFLADDGTIVSVQDLTPLDETQRPAPQAVRLALEMNRGWFARHGVGVGSKVSV